MISYFVVLYVLTVEPPNTYLVKQLDSCKTLKITITRKDLLLVVTSSCICDIDRWVFNYTGSDEEFVDVKTANHKG